MSEVNPYKVNKIHADMLGLLTCVSVLLAVLFIFDETFGQWSTPWGWASSKNAHGPYLIVMIAWILSVALLFVVGGWWFSNTKNKRFPHRNFAIMTAFLIFSSAAYFPSNQQYAAAAVLLFGLGENSIRFQRDAVVWDSAVLINALLARGAKIERYIPCNAMRNGSRAVLNILSERGFKSANCG